MLLPFASFAAILNAGLVATARVAMGGELVWKVDPTSWWDIQRVNVLGVLNTIRAAVPGMVRTDMTRELIRWMELDEDSLTPIETGAELIVRLA